jgi:hypothetical protein
MNTFSAGDIMTTMYFTSLATLISDMENSIPEADYFRATFLSAECLDDIFHELLFINKVALYNDHSSLPLNFNNDFSFVNSLLAEVGEVLRYMETEQEKLSSSQGKKGIQNADLSSPTTHAKRQEALTRFSNMGALLTSLTSSIPEDKYLSATCLTNEAQDEILKTLLLINKAVIGCVKPEVGKNFTAKISIFNAFFSEMGSVLRDISNKREALISLHKGAPIE